ncbi:MAG: tetratricopeptide repeat protein [Spirochaetia bacterium]
MQFIVILIIVLGSFIGFFTFFLIKSFIAPKRVASLEKMLKQSRYTAVTRSAKHIIAKEPRSADPHWFLALAYLGENKPELALMELKTINQLGQFGTYCKEVPFRKKISELYMKFNQHEEALKEYLLLIKAEPYEADHYYNVGLLFEERNRTDKALSYFKKAVEIDPRHSDAHFKTGLILYKNRKPVESRSEFESAIKYNSDNYDAHFYLGKLMKEGHEYVAALIEFEKAQKAAHLKVKALVERGGCYMSMNNFERAISELERAIKLAQNDAAPEVLFGRYFLSICYEKMRNIDSAIEQWEKIYSKKPSFRDVAEKLSQYQELRSDDKVKDYLTSGTEEFLDICKAITTQSLGLTARDISEIPNGCQIIAVEPDSGKWRNTRKMPRIIKFFRVPDILDDGTVRYMNEEMKKLGITRGVIITSSTFSRKAVEFAETRPINLYNKEQLQELLKKVNLEESVRH